MAQRARWVMARIWSHESDFTPHDGDVESDTTNVPTRPLPSDNGPLGRRLPRSARAASHGRASRGAASCPPGVWCGPQRPQPDDPPRSRLPAKVPPVPRQQMMTERMIGIAPVVIAVLAGSFLAALMPSSTWVAITLAATVVVTVMLWVRMRRSQRHHHRR